MQNQCFFPALIKFVRTICSLPSVLSFRRHSLCVQSTRVDSTDKCSYPRKVAGDVAPSTIYETARSHTTVKQPTVKIRPHRNVNTL